jgi:hypothetical protein
MTQQIINLGIADKGNGDVLRTAFGKVNANFAELYNQIATSVVVGATAPTEPEEGALWWNSESGRMYVYYGTAWVDASPVDGAGISSTNQLVNGAYTLSLGANGALTFPDATVQTTAWTGSVSSLVNGNAEVILENDGEITSVLFPTRGIGKIFLSGSEIGTTPAGEGTYSAPLVLSSFSNDVKISANGIGPVNPVWQFKTDGTLTLPPQDTTLTNVSQIVTAKIYRATDSTNATAIRGAKEVWLGNEQTFTDIRDQDAQLIAGGGYTRPWTGMPSWEALPLITTYQPTGSQLPVPGGLAPAANNAKNAYLAWKELVSNIDIVSGDKTFSFENSGELRVPGVITSDDLMRLNSVATASTNNASVIAEGDGGIVFIKTGDGISIDNTWTFDLNGNLTFPDGTTTTGESITLLVDQSLTVNTSYSAGPGGTTTFKISPEHIKLPTGNGFIYSGTETAANRWGLDSANKTLYFPDAEDGVFPQINYSNADTVTGMELITYAKTIKITTAQTNSWTFGTDGALTVPSVLWNYTPTTFTSIPTTYGAAQLTFTVLSDNTFTNMSVAVGGGGYGADNQQLTVPGTTFPGGASPANDIVFNVTTFPVPDFPSEITTASIVTYVSGNPPPRYDNIESSGNVGIGANNSHWTFGTNGALTLPDASVIASYKPVTVIAATTTAQTITDNASAAFIQFVETVDTAGAFSPGTFTAPYTGYYQINMSVYFSTAVSLTSTSFLLIDTNLDFTKQVRIIDGNWAGSYLHYSTVISAAAGDAIRVAFRQVSGGDVEISSGSRLTIHRVSIS